MSTIPNNPKPNSKADPNPNSNPNQTLALWRISAQWTFGIVDL